MPDLLNNFFANITQSFLSPDSLASSSTKALIVFGLVFVVAIFMAVSRRILIHGALEGVWAGFIIGIIFVLAFEGLLFWGTKNFLSGDKVSVLPESVLTVLQGGQENLTQVLGVKAEKERPTAQSVVTDFDYLGELDASLVKNSICKE